MADLLKTNIEDELVIFEKDDNGKDEFIKLSKDSGKIDITNPLEISNGTKTSKIDLDNISDINTLKQNGANTKDTENISGDMTQILYNIKKELREYVEGLLVNSIGGDGKYIKSISQSDGKIASSAQSFDTSISSSSTNNNAPTSKAVNDLVNTKINNLDMAQIGGDGKYIKYVSEADGKISATSQSFDTSISSSSTNNNAPTSKAVQDLINTLDVGSVGGDNSYINSISQTDGKIKANAKYLDSKINPSSNFNSIPSSASVLRAIQNIKYGSSEVIPKSGLFMILGSTSDSSPTISIDAKFSVTRLNGSTPTTRVETISTPSYNIQKNTWYKFVLTTTSNSCTLKNDYTNRDICSASVTTGYSGSSYQSATWNISGSGYYLVFIPET